MCLLNQPQQTPKLTQSVLNYHTFILANEKGSQHANMLTKSGTPLRKP